MRKLIYGISIFLTAIALFWPIIYGNVSALHELPGNPVLQAIVGVLLFGGIAYFAYEEEGGEANEREELTAS
ncbi:hypothetical protein A3L11_00940 [Thermococcus siculi]|uniref:Uncharacterized protein n=1 Tax=Thermococcus siculi TaxID=72803 RepID=A0A2Z2MHH5_9EURY|nr:hypothetical protein [Thermococcus siculi]ASJ07862.1 hypothetical protein A3L11_00940 [Thermococcus siculi]